MIDPAVIQSIQNLVDYNYSDELRDLEEQRRMGEFPEDSTEGHIFGDIERIEAWLREGAPNECEFPWVVGENPVFRGRELVSDGSVVERFKTHDEAAQYITDNFPADKVEAGDYYIDGPERED